MIQNRLTLLLAFLATAFLSQAQYLHWVKKLGGSGTDYCTTLHSDSRSNVYMGAAFSNSITFEGQTFTASNGMDALLTKYDSTGKWQWTKQISGNGDQFTTTIKTGTDGSIYLLGSFSGTVDADPSANVTLFTSKGFNDFFLAKYNPDGNLVWAHPFGSTRIDYGNGLAVTASAVYITGSFSESMAFNPAKPDSLGWVSKGGEDLFLGKFTLNGQLKWMKSVGETDQESGEDLVVDASENLYITGFFHKTLDLDPKSDKAFNVTSVGGRDVLVAQYDSSGAFLWGGAFGSPYNDLGISIALHSNNRIAITGELSSTADVDFSANQKLLSPVSGASADAFAVEYTTGGQYVWSTTLGGNSYESGKKIAYDKKGNLYVVLAALSTSLPFDKNENTVYLTTHGDYDGVAVKYTADKKFAYGIALGSTGGEGTDGMCVDNMSNLYLAGYYVGTTDFDPQATSSLLTLTGPTDGYLARYGDEALIVTSTESTEEAAPLVCFPNPFKNELHFHSSPTDPITEVKLMDLTGSVVHSSTINQNVDNVLSTSELAPGLYQVSLKTDKGIQIKKMLKQ